MSTATPTEPTHGDVSSSTGAKAAWLDPEKDIDAKKTVIVLVIATVFVFGSVWILSYIFSAVSFSQVVERVERAPTPQITELRTYEAEMLQAGESPKRMSIEQAMQELRTDK
ncbi:MAG: hypothetical protein KDB80_14690 [Planctomycetes bacterium]|nr:hypothetical protein [Planctomycetota bacterium]